MNENVPKILFYLSATIVVIFLGIVMGLVGLIAIDFLFHTHYSENLVATQEWVKGIYHFIELTILIIFLFMLFFVLRGFMLWYWRVDDIANKLEGIHEELKKISSKQL